MFKVHCNVLVVLRIKVIIIITHSSLETLGLRLCVTNIAIHCKTLHNPMLVVCYSLILINIVLYIKLVLSQFTLYVYAFIFTNLIRKIKTEYTATVLLLPSCVTLGKVDQAVRVQM